MAAKGVLGGDYTYHYTEAGFQKRFWFSAFGYTDEGRESMEQGSFPFARHSQRELVLYHTARVLFTDECHGIHER